MRLEIGTDQHLVIGARAVAAPEQFAGIFVQCRQPTVDTHLPARIADVDPPLSNRRSHRDALTLIDVTELRTP